MADNTICTSYKVFNKTDSKNKEAIKCEILSMINPHIIRSLNIIKKWFVEIFEDQKPFTHKTCQEVIFKILEARSKKLKDRVVERWASCAQTL